MSKKSTLILLSILHICILGICILTIYANKNRTSEAMIARISSDTKIADTQTEPAVETNPVAEPEPSINTEPSVEPEPETEPAAEPEPESIPEPETTPEPDAEPELSPVYSFHYIGTRANLNIRSAPSLDDTIIGKVPCGGDGDVLELTNDEWALIEYQGIIGYCNRNFLELTEIDNKQE